MYLKTKQKKKAKNYYENLDSKETSDNSGFAIVRDFRKFKDFRYFEL